jgi:hypothetical protein
VIGCCCRVVSVSVQIKRTHQTLKWHKVHLFRDSYNL